MTVRNDELNIDDLAGKHVHMIGIGGASMSGLAMMLKGIGCKVTGSSNLESRTLENLRKQGIPVEIGHSERNVREADLVVYTTAIPEDNPELLAARELGIPTMDRPALLALISDRYTRSVSVCGTHGKTTTTSMLTEILVACSMDPTVHIGGKLDSIGGSIRTGESDIFVTEACEYKRAFLTLNPFMEVVLNIDADHLDCYRDIDEIERTFGQFMDKVPDHGYVIGNGEDLRVTRQMGRLSCHTETFGLSESCDWHPSDYEEDEEGRGRFKVCHRGEIIGEVAMSVPGSFNSQNALAAVAAACTLGADPAVACERMSLFRGARRRFEKTGVVDGVELFHDYGHNPAEIRNAVMIAEKHCSGRLFAVVQPHTYSRVKALFDDYLTCTELADVTLVTDIYGAREADPGDIDSGMLVSGMREHGIDAFWTPSFDDAENMLRSLWKPGDMVITLGCGNIDMLNEQIEGRY
ncbi:MAG: UDP-N-acetylmuramate--L-alanine ligase [Eubacterium sp.]|nr:UDP-N-acetylmuramate--L-alanine ligase [Eubacterium sp.]